MTTKPLCDAKIQDSIDYLFVDLSKDLMNPTFPGTCKTHGDGDFMEICLQGDRYHVCVQCWSDGMQAMHDAQHKAMVASGVVESIPVTYVKRKEP